MLLQHLSNVIKIDLDNLSPTSVRKIACLLVVTSCLAEALPSLAVKMKTRKRAKPSTDIAIRIKPYISFKKSREVAPKS